MQTDPYGQPAHVRSSAWALGVPADITTAVTAATAKAVAPRNILRMHVSLIRDWLRQPSAI
jgi:hypothetical protein